MEKISYLSKELLKETSLSILLKDEDLQKEMKMKKSPSSSNSKKVGMKKSKSSPINSKSNIKKKIEQIIQDVKNKKEELLQKFYTDEKKLCRYSREELESKKIEACIIDDVIQSYQMYDTFRKTKMFLKSCLDCYEKHFNENLIKEKLRKLSNKTNMDHELEQIREGESDFLQLYKTCMTMNRALTKRKRFFHKVIEMESRVNN